MLSNYPKTLGGKKIQQLSQNDDAELPPPEVTALG